MPLPLNFEFSYSPGDEIVIVSYQAKLLFLVQTNCVKQELHVQLKSSKGPTSC